MSNMSHSHLHKFKFLNIYPCCGCILHHTLNSYKHAWRPVNHFPGFLFGTGWGCKHCSLCPTTLESCEKAAAESTISIIGARQACPRTGNPTKPARRQMTAPQRQHRWLAADHLEQKCSATLQSLRDTTERRVWTWEEEGENYEGVERRRQSEEYIWWKTNKV